MFFSTLRFFKKNLHHILVLVCNYGNSLTLIETTYWGPQVKWLWISHQLVLKRGNSDKFPLHNSLHWTEENILKTSQWVQLVYIITMDEEQIDAFLVLQQWPKPYCLSCSVDLHIWKFPGESCCKAMSFRNCASNLNVARGCTIWLWNGLQDNGSCDYAKNTSKFCQQNCAPTFQPGCFNRSTGYWCIYRLSKHAWLKSCRTTFGIVGVYRPFLPCLIMLTQSAWGQSRNF